MLAKELFPGQYKPTPTHLFIRLLHDKGLLRRCFTQNIDSLEVIINLDFGHSLWA
jgi:NAD-dependent SIR2 family protein deacetylase